MVKQEIINKVASKFKEMGINFEVGNGTDILVFTEFLDAGWSTGSKKISYEASIFADESSNTVYMWEMTKEIGYGLSFGGESGSSFQMGKTLFRKVKSVQYAPDGKVYEYTLDLGQIPKTVKEITNQYGWKFKTVIKKEKAMFPIGYVPMGNAMQNNYGENKEEDMIFCMNCGFKIKKSANFCEKCGKPLKSKEYWEKQYSDLGKVNSIKYKEDKDKKGNKLGIIGFILLSIFAILIFMLMSVNFTGWILGAATIIFFFILQKKTSKKGCLLSIILWIIMAFILLLIMTFTSPIDGKKDNTNVKKPSNSSFNAKLPYEKTFPLNDGKSIGKFRLFVSDGTGLYQNYKGKVICEFYVKFDTRSLPKDFKLYPSQATAKDAMGNPALDSLVMAICSDKEAYHTTSLSYAQAMVKDGKLVPFVETEGATADIHAESIIEMANKYPKMQVLRYNVNEVGMTKQNDTYIIHSEKAFGLHPPVVEGNIPWDEILKDLGLK
ncbi:zinc ribbon domain-containing protein [Clostridium sp. SYSU_GA19001]|uniref:zinc-ribbon domain-containing protein n=1 Tax=Clostridium caldaquaticum TaxID=2940653 RepID=UPI0020774A28|nr:zinc ribbon domain-containing protein [Clostridium caldaquaticum]MCM8712135.1 zinc ribbon domain-containing protein [Clostridium caldaquaticum]